jgi:uncharacterized short protein YbdD (DUF466 family)
MTGASHTAHRLARGFNRAPQELQRAANQASGNTGVCAANMQRGPARCYDCRVNSSAVSRPADGLVARVARVLRRIIGAPDYERYVEHVRVAHPGEEPMSEAEFSRMQLEGKYSRPGTRCC